MSVVVNKEQERAKYAYDFAKIGSELPKEKAKEYKSNVKKLPMLIKTNGLGAALAFFFSKGKDNEKSPHILILSQIHDWLKKNNSETFTNSSVLLKTIVELDSANYRSITHEVMSFLNWLKRFADGLIEEK